MKWGIKIVLSVIIFLNSRLLSIQTGDFVPTTPDWGYVYGGKDSTGNWEAIMENNKIALRYGFKMSGDSEEGMITQFIVKAFPDENIAGALLEAAAHRGLISNAEVVKNNDEEKTVRIKWIPTPGSKDRHPGPAVSDISIFRDKNYIRIIYKSFCFPHICDIASPGGMKTPSTESDCGGKYYIYGYFNENPPLYEQCLFWEKEGCMGCEGENASPAGIAEDPSQLNYKGWFIMGVYYEENQHGYGRIIPVVNMRVIKLLWNKGFELFPKGEKSYLISSYMATSVSKKNSSFYSLELQQNYPNPFTTSTTILFSTPIESLVSSTVFNAKGEAVDFKTDIKAIPGNNTIYFNGSSLLQGCYLYAIETKKYRLTKKMILVK